VSGGPLAIALAALRLEPAGGREMQCLALAAELMSRGHAVTIVSTTPPTRLPPGLNAMLIRRRGLTNHGRLAAFARDAAAVVRGRFDRAVVFHLVPGFDVIFAVDPLRRTRSWRALSPRHRTFAALEAAALGPGSRSRVLTLTSAQAASFQALRGLTPDRAFVLPPAVDPGRIDPTLAAAGMRPAPPPERFPTWLWVAVQPKTKGLDRVVAALAGQPMARLLTAGLPKGDPKAWPILQAAQRSGVAERIEWRGYLGNEALKHAMAQADLLVHPARADLTGNVIVEALANGLPVVASAACGFAEHVERSGGGLVVAEPFRQADLENALAAASPAACAAWSAKALAYARQTDLFRGLPRAADLIENYVSPRP
jgi:UDP-glucose:(heptosyl)LPS alpha-1,3-glucosyltransferase